MLSDEGFFKADHGNLPNINMFIITDFLKRDTFQIPESRGVKTSQSMSNSYVEAAVGNVCVKRENNICIVKSKVCPEHKVRNPPYDVTVLINESDEKIDDAKCCCPASATVGCKHFVAYIFWLYNRSMEQATTSTDCYWRKSRLSKSVTERDFVTAQDFCVSTRKATNVPIDGTLQNFCSDVFHTLQENQIDSQISRYIVDFNIQHLNIWRSLLEFRNQHEVDDFLLFIQEKCTENLLSSIEMKTRGQSNSMMWHSERFGRVSASIIDEAASCHTDGYLVEKILGVRKIKTTQAMERGLRLEKLVNDIINENTGIHFSPAGFFIVKEYPILGASPDGISDDLILEIKCPMSQKTVTNYIKNGKPTKKFYGQMQLQMLATKRKRCMFCVADPNVETNRKVNVLYVNFDEEYIDDLCLKAIDFWKTYIFPKLLKSAKI